MRSLGKTFKILYLGNVSKHRTVQRLDCQIKSTARVSPSPFLQNHWVNAMPGESEKLTYNILTNLYMENFLGVFPETHTCPDLYRFVKTPTAYEELLGWIYFFKSSIGHYGNTK